MPLSSEKTALMRYLQAKDSSYYEKARELRTEISGWLDYIPHTFPHYTRHTIEHSDEIIRQISNLLFSDDDPDKPVLNLSAVEAYILVAAAYLHDAGMVVPDAEKARLLGSEEWKDWTTGDGAGAKRFFEVEMLRKGSVPPDEAQRHFLADLQIRYLVAEFVRRTHHRRAVDIMGEHEATLGRFAFADPILLRTIGDVCVAHGLHQEELEDRERYPDRRDVRGEKVNVRMLAILLRLGDLLDMSADRACPLLLNAACPIPNDSLAHWTQYQRITHRLVAPDRIELTAECLTQEEHRFLQDWCAWLTNEVKRAGPLIARGKRHQELRLPEVELEGPSKTIKILPAPGANYKPANWVFQLDPPAVFERLVRDVYDTPLAFIRELLQNAIDASRCQMYADLKEEGIEPPEYPTQVEEERRARYPVLVTLVEREVLNSLSGENEKRQVLSVEDYGIGMDADIIQRYFLQVGRSYYTTGEFQRKFGFVPTSRFGVGFLSVFGASDHITVETYSPNSPTKDGPIRLTLTGPRNYLLTQAGERRKSGTRIEVLLRESLEALKLTKQIEGWCRRVEFPIQVDDLGQKRTITAERCEDFVSEAPDLTKDGAKFVIRVFPVNRPGIEGDLYVFAHIDEEGELWDMRSWAVSDYPKLHPGGQVPELPRSICCLHGICLSYDPSLPMGTSARVDFRSLQARTTLSRSGRNDSRWHLFAPEIIARWEEIVIEHLVSTPRAQSTLGWRYKHRLVGNFRPLDEFWWKCPGTMPVYVSGDPVFLSLDELASKEVFKVLCWNGPPASESAIHWKRPDFDYSVPTLWVGDFVYMNSYVVDRLFEHSKPCGASWLDEQWIAIDWRARAHSARKLFRGDNNCFEVFSLPNDLLGIPVSLFARYFELICLNSDLAFGQWFNRAVVACNSNAHGLGARQLEVLAKLTRDAVGWGGGHLTDLQEHLSRWREMPNLPKDLYPPNIELTDEMFGRKSWLKRPSAEGAP